MTPRLVTPPTVEPVRLDEAKLHLRVISDDEDDLITGLIVSARTMVESGEAWSLDRSLVTTTWRVTLDRFPCVVELPRPPLISVTSITYKDSGGTTQTLSGTGYTVDAQGEPGRLVPAYGLVWPATRSDVNAVAITYTAGYGPTAADVPQAIKQAILLLVGDMYWNRETIVTGTIVASLPTIRSLLSSFQWHYR